MNRHSIRFRLTAWYSVVLALALIVFGAASWFVIEQILFHTVNRELVDRIEGVRRFMDHQIGSLSLEEIRDEFKEHSVLGPGGDLFQVCDENGIWIYRSAPLVDASVPIRRPAEIPNEGVWEDLRVGHAHLRFLSRRAVVLGKPYTIQVAATTHELMESLEIFRWTLILLVPAVLLIAAAGGWWMSRRALDPVDRVTAAARSIGERSLGQRLPVPKTNDELQRLSETLNQMLARLEGSFHRITQFTADASHELRSPISVIRTNAEIALRRERSGREYQHTLAEIVAESERITELLDDLLALARADAGKATLAREPVDLAALAHEGVKRVQARAEEKELDVRVHTRGSMLSGDTSSLRRLILILLDNAIKYTPAGGEVSIESRTVDRLVELEVADTGIGIAPEDLPHIFERFYRADKARNRDSGGVGLGLALASWIAAAHGGSIQVNSELGKGSRFVVSLPAGAMQ